MTGKKTRKGSRGQAMIEVAILGPVLILLLMIFTEYSLFFLAGQKIETLSREAAQTAFHDCRGATDARERLVCLDRVANNTMEILTRVLATSSTPVANGDFRIIMTSWQMNPAVPTEVIKTPPVAGTTNPVQRGALSGVSKYNNASDFDVASAGGGNYNLIREIGGLFTCEIFYRHQASRSIPRSINFWDFTFSFPLLNNTIYAASAS
ncbi:MAG: TadE family protein [Candidatus Omnitrophota bacterium]